MKRTLAVILALAMSLSLVACGSKDKEKPGDSDGQLVENGTPANSGTPMEQEPVQRTTPAPTPAPSASGFSFDAANVDLSGTSDAYGTATFAYNETDMSENLAGVANGSYTLEDLKNHFDSENLLVSELGEGVTASDGFNGKQTWTAKEEGGHCIATYSCDMSEADDTYSAAAALSAYLGMAITRDDLSNISHEAESWMGVNGAGDNYWVELSNASKTDFIRLVFWSDYIELTAQRTF